MCRKTCNACPPLAQGQATGDEDTGAGGPSIFVALVSLCSLGAAVLGAFHYYRRYRSGDALQGAYINLAGGESDRDRLQ